ncbi:MAG: SDR family oxidoreductase [Dehalococcoidia bacterium]
MQRAQVVVVTGASAGIGRAIARAFGDEGARVALLARDEARLNAALDEVRDAGGEGTAIVTDVADADQLERAAMRVESELGPIDVWVNNAMTTVFGPVQDITPEEFRRVTDVTYHGTVYGTMSALKRMRERDRGVIIQVGSALAYRSIPLQAAYCGAKHAMKGFTEALRTELIHDGSNVQVSMVHLAAFNTPQFSWSRSHLPQHPQPLPPIYQPELAARAVLWTSKHPRREVYVGAGTVTAIVWNKFFPGLLDRSLAISGYEEQMTNHAVDPNAPGNLFGPVEGVYGARGIFNEKALDDSLQFRMATQFPVPAIPNAITAIVGGTREGFHTVRALVTKRRQQRQQDIAQAKNEGAGQPTQRAA